MAPLSESPGVSSTQSHTGRLAQVARGTCGPFALRPTTATAALWLGPTRLSHLKRLHGRAIDRELKLLPKGASKWLAKKVASRRFRVRVHREGVSAAQHRRLREEAEAEEARGEQPDWLQAPEEGLRRRDLYMADHEVRSRARDEPDANASHHKPPGTPALASDRHQPPEAQGARHRRRKRNREASVPPRPVGDVEAGPGLEEDRLPPPPEKMPRFLGGKPGGQSSHGAAASSSRGGGWQDQSWSWGGGWYVDGGWYDGWDSWTRPSKGSKGKGKWKDKGKRQSEAQAAARAATKAERAEARAQLDLERQKRRAICYRCEDEVGLEAAPMSTVRFFPCKHIVVCATHAPSCRVCPYCKKPVKERVALREDGVIPPDFEPDVAEESEYTSYSEEEALPRGRVNTPGPQFEEVPDDVAAAGAAAPAKPAAEPAAKPTTPATEPAADAGGGTSVAGGATTAGPDLPSPPSSAFGAEGASG